MKTRWAISVAFLTLVLLAMWSAPVRSAELLKSDQPYCFTDQCIAVPVAVDGATVPCSVRTITADGWGPTVSGKMQVVDRTIQITPLVEGIHLVMIEGVKEPVRFLAIQPPPAASPEAIRRQLPQQAEALLGGKPFTIIAMGDSVTHTGDYETMLRMMLERATGNRQIRILDKSYPGRSVDAAVRFYRDDVLPNAPHLGLLMYGLNDQICHYNVASYLEQCRWVARRFREDAHADFVFLQPTPHIDVFPGKETNSPEFAFRTIGFAEALRGLAGEMRIPLAETFRALWLPREDILSSATAMRAFYPPGYDRQMQSMIETETGDTIHPNALGHLMIARAVYSAITGQCIPAAGLEIQAQSRWDEKGLCSELTVTNRSGKPRKGRLQTYPLLETGPVVLGGDGLYDLAPDVSTSFTARWIHITKPADLNTEEGQNLRMPGYPRVAIVDQGPDGCAVYCPHAPILPQAQFLRQRFNDAKGSVSATLESEGKTSSFEVQLPDNDVGRIPLIRGRCVAELAYVRYAQAEPGEAAVDGKLDEWAQQKVWSPVGEACQARFAGGPKDLRSNAGEFNSRWAFRSGKDGLYVAVRVTGEAEKDAFFLFFDVNEPEHLGEPNRYYWVSGGLKPDGSVQLSKGETSRDAAGMIGKWSKTPTGASIELRIPYTLMEQDAWPVSGDLGLSIWWMHHGPSGKTDLQWSEDGHPWNTRWYGILRQGTAEPKDLPFMVRIK